MAARSAKGFGRGARGGCVLVTAMAATPLAGCQESEPSIKIAILNPALDIKVRGDGLPCALFPSNSAADTVRMRLFMRGPQLASGATRINVFATDEPKRKRERIHAEHLKVSLKPQTWIEVYTEGFRVPRWARKLLITTDAEVDFRGRRLPLHHERWCRIDR